MTTRFLIKGKDQRETTAIFSNIELLCSLLYSVSLYSRARGRDDVTSLNYPQHFKKIFF